MERSDRCRSGPESVCIGFNHELDPVAVGPVREIEKGVSLGDSFQTATGENATVTEMVKGRVSYTFAGGSGVLLNG
jgi:hypothetical protein